MHTDLIDAKPGRAGNARALAYLALLAATVAALVTASVAGANPPYKTVVICAPFVELGAPDEGPPSGWREITIPRWQLEGWLAKGAFVMEDGRVCPPLTPLPDPEIPDVEPEQPEPVDDKPAKPKKKKKAKAGGASSTYVEPVAAGEELPFTGLPAILLALLGGSMVAGGAWLRRRGR